MPAVSAWALMTCLFNPLPPLPYTRNTYTPAMNDKYFTEREGILVDAAGKISLRHDGQLRPIAAAVPLLPAKADDPDPAHWAVRFEDGTTATIGRPIMKAALMRRMMECPMSVLFHDETES